MNSETKAELLELALGIAKSAGDLLMARPDVFDLETKSTAIDFATQMELLITSTELPAGMSALQQKIVKASKSASFMHLQLIRFGRQLKAAAQLVMVRR